MNIKIGKTLVKGKEKYSFAAKKELGELVLKYKKEYDKEVKALHRKTHYGYKPKKHVPIKPKQGFLAAAVPEFYNDLADVKHDDNNLSKALIFVKKRNHEKYLNDGFLDEERSKKGFCESGGGSK